MSEIAPAADADGRSPWAGLQGVRFAEVGPVGRPVSGTVVVPGSKSFTNRALILAGVAEGSSTLSGLLRSDDSFWCIDALKRLGVDVEVDGTTVRIDGCGARWPAAEADLFIGSAGTVGRFLPGVLSAAPAGRYRIRASRQLEKRPVAPLLEALAALGARTTHQGQPGAYPMTIAASGLHGGRVAMSGRVSSQFISGMLIAAPLAASSVRLDVVDRIVQSDYVRMTLDTMAAFGAGAIHDDALSRFDIEPQRYRGRSYAIEADASTTTYFVALAAVTGGRVAVDNIGTATRQPDLRFIDVLERMGCAIERRPDRIVVAGPARLRGGLTVDMNPMSDATLTLAALAPFADAPIVMTGVAHIRKHESDRIAVMAQALAALGIGVEERPDGLVVSPGRPRFAELETHDDHRVAMSLAVLGAAASGVRLSDPGCVSKTCPVFFEALGALGVPVSLS
ncbi:MAG: 3-phosphoshikimate 1-carboxyvinyltransferase [Alphaproteobacteria bacterium]|nr:3-phosphoshikimate 1-carboxyvinyltransferase [Alphaproteobacteria bacterium]